MRRAGAGWAGGGSQVWFSLSLGWGAGEAAEASAQANLERPAEAGTARRNTEVSKALFGPVGRGVGETGPSERRASERGEEREGEGGPDPDGAGSASEGRVAGTHMRGPAAEVRRASLGRGPGRPAS